MKASFCSTLCVFVIISVTHALYQYIVPNGYTIVQTPLNADPIPLGQIYGAAIGGLLEFAYANDPNGLNTRKSLEYPAVTLNVTGGGKKGEEGGNEYYNQFATSVIYHALNVLISQANVTDPEYAEVQASYFTLENASGDFSCRVIFGPPSLAWQQLVNGVIGSGGAAPPKHRRGLENLASPYSLPRLQTRWETSIVDHVRRQTTPPAPATNSSSILETWTPFYTTDWYGTRTLDSDFFLAIATYLIRITEARRPLDTLLSDTFNYPPSTPGPVNEIFGGNTYFSAANMSYYGFKIFAYSKEQPSRPLGGTPFGGPEDELPIYQDHFTWRGVLALLTNAYNAGAEAASSSSNFKDIRYLESRVLWTNATFVMGDYVLRYEGANTTVAGGP